jgi:hypothetical protein
VGAACRLYRGGEELQNRCLAERLWKVRPQRVKAP